METLETSAMPRMATIARSSFMELPTEIRLKIFDYMFDEIRAIIQSTSKSQLLLTIPKPIDTAIFRCSRRLNEEANISFFANLTFHLQAEALSGLQAGTMWMEQESLWDHIVRLRPLIQKLIVTLDSSKGGSLASVFSKFAQDFKYYQSLRQCTIRDVQVCSINNVFQHKRVSASEYERMSEQDRINYFKAGSELEAAKGAPGDRKPQFYEDWNSIRQSLQLEWRRVWEPNQNIWWSGLNEAKVPQALADSRNTMKFNLELESRIIFWPYWAPVHIESQISEIDPIECELKGTRIVTEREKRSRIEERPFR